MVKKTLKSTEYDGLVAAYQYAVFHMVAQAARQYRLLDIAPVAHQIVHRIAVVDAHRILFDDRPGIQLVGHVMAGRADEFDAALMGLVIRLRTDEGRQEAVVNVDDAARVALAQCGRQDLHEPRQYHDVAAMLFEQCGDSVECRSLVLHIDMDERDAMPFDEA